MGQFDQSVDEDGVNLTPVPELDPTAAALDPAAAMIPPALLQGPMPTLAPMAAPVPMPTPPQAPAPPGQAQKLISLALLGLAAGLGPRHAGGGIARGVMAGQDANEADRRQQFKDQQAQYVQQQNEAVRLQGLADAQAKAAAVEYEKRMVKRQQILASVAKAVPSFTTKEDYDKFMDYAGNMAVQSGFRDLSPLALRSNFTFVAPSQKQVIAKQVEAALKRGKDLGQDPEQILQGSLYVDMVGDGKPTSFATKPMSELMPLAGMDVVRIEGKPVGTKPKGGDSTFDQTLASKVAVWRADHPGEKAIPPKVMDQLVTEARTPVKTPKDAGDVPMVQVSEVDPDTGEIVTSLVPKKEGEISRKPPKEPNQAQFQAGAYAGRMEQSAKIIDSLESGIAGMNMIGFAAQQRLPSALQTDNYQSFDQAARNFINAVLRKESGATITPAEFDNARKQYLPVAGDTPQTLAQKKANRDYALKSMKASAGRAYEAPIDVPNADDAIIAARKKGRE